MKILVGLGNPGDRYKNTRHNTGFLYLDFLVDELKSRGIEINWENKPRFKAVIADFKYEGKKVVLIKPQTYMNESGWSVSQYTSWNKIDPGKVILIHDDLDIPLGMFKYNTQKGPKVHYGIISVESYLKRKDFNRLRIGVDNRGGNRIPSNGVDYLMSNFDSDERNTLQNTFKDSLNEVLTSLK